MGTSIRDRAVPQQFLHVANVLRGGGLRQSADLLHNASHVAHNP